MNIRECTLKTDCQSSYEKVGAKTKTVSCCSNADNCNAAPATYTGLKCYRGGGILTSGGPYNALYEYGNNLAYCSVNLEGKD